MVARAVVLVSFLESLWDAVLYVEIGLAVYL